MKFVFETVAETQGASLAAASIFTENVLSAIERLAQLNIELTRTAFEKSAEMTLVCLKAENAFAWHAFNRSGEA